MSISNDNNQQQLQQQQQQMQQLQFFPMMTNPNSFNPTALIQSEYFPDCFQFLGSEQSKGLVDLLSQSNYSHLITKQGPLGGYTALHWMCIKNEYDLIEDLIVKCNADVNSRANLGESPLFVCIKNCNLYTIELLIRHGADLNHRDIYNRSLIHWSAYTGKVILFYYFQKYHSINNLNEVDQFQQNALHIACASGFSDLIMYIINRSDIDCMLQDFNGNTCLHMAAKCGLGRICWLLTQQNKGECAKLIGVMNNQNQRPYDIIRNERGPQFKKIRDWLRLEAKTNKWLLPSGGTILFNWNSNLQMNLEWTLRFTAFLLVVTIPLLLNKFLIYPNQLSLLKGLVGYSTFLGIIIVITRQKHRISHISGLQNPYFVGFITSLFVLNYPTFYLYLFMPFSFSMSLTDLITVVLSIWHVYTYYKVISTPAGFCKESFKKPDGTPYDLRDLMKINAKNPKGGKDSINWLTEPPTFNNINLPIQLPQLYFCDSCLIIQSVPTKHCKLCEGCCAKFDHHCLFISKCVGIKNHRAFIIFLIATIICCSIFVYSILNYFINFNEKLNIENRGKKEDDQTDLFYFLFSSTFHIWLVVLGLINIFMTIMVLCLFLYQIQFLTLGYTSQFKPPVFFNKTHKRMSSIIDSLKHRCENLYIFFFESCEINEELYFRQQREYNSSMSVDKPVVMGYYPRDADSNSNLLGRNKSFDPYPRDDFKINPINAQKIPNNNLQSNSGNGKQFEIDLD